MLRAGLRWLRRALIGLVAGVVLYMGMALLLGLLAVNRDWRDAGEDGVEIWLTSNGVHVSLLLPARHPAMDWTALFPPEHTLTGALPAGMEWVEIGWGERTFFLHTPTWADLTVRRALYALSGLGGAVLRVTYRWAPPPIRTARLRLSETEYRRLTIAIRAAVPLTDGRARWIAGAHYGVSDAFYEAAGRYSPIFTCNQWGRDALAEAGVRMPVWAPFGQALFWQVRDAPGR